MKITIPHLPYRELNPNSRVHWRTHRRVSREAKDEVIALVREQGCFYPLKKAHLSICFYVKDNRRRDIDNLLAAMKPCIDGLVAAGVIEDDAADVLSLSMYYYHDSENATTLAVI